MPAGAAMPVPVTVVGRLTDAGAVSLVGAAGDFLGAAGLEPLRVIPILGGLGAALCRGRIDGGGIALDPLILGSQQALAYVMLLGFVALALLAPVKRPAGPLRLATRGSGRLLAGAGSAAGLSMMYRALRLGKVGVVAPIASTEGAHRGGDLDRARRAGRRPASPSAWWSWPAASCS